MMEKRGKNEFWRRRAAFAREIERDTKEKSEEVAQRLAQAVRADEEKQAGRRAARERAAGRAGGPPRQPEAKAQAARTDGWGRSGPARTQAGAWDERESGPARTKISARGEAAGGAHLRTGAQSGAPHAGAGEWERAPGLHTMELRIPGTYLTGTQPGGMMEEISRRVAAAVQPGSPALRPSPMPPAQRAEALPGLTGETPAQGTELTPYGLNSPESGVRLLRAAPQNLQAGFAHSGAKANESLFSDGRLGMMRPADEPVPPDYTDPQWWMDWVDSTHEGHPVWKLADSNPSYLLFKLLVPALSKKVKTVELDLTMHNLGEGIKAYSSSNKAQLGKEVLFPNDPNLNIDGAKPNAFLHAFWNAQMAYRIGPEMAELFATAHEAYLDHQYESDILNTIDSDTGLTIAQNIVMDMHNNSVGRSLAAKMPDTPEAIHEELFSRYGSEEAIQQALELCQGFDEADLLLFHYTNEAMDQLQWLYE